MRILEAVTVLEFLALFTAAPFMNHVQILSVGSLVIALLVYGKPVIKWYKEEA
jgi:hypothetical protein